MLQRHRHRLALFLLAATILSSALPHAAVAQTPDSLPAVDRPSSDAVAMIDRSDTDVRATPTVATPPLGASGVLPSIHHEDAMAHEDDVYEFAPGVRASVPFKPRHNDRWNVGGRPSRPLPAGLASGRQLVLQANGETDVPTEETQPASASPAPLPAQPSGEPEASLALEATVEPARTHAPLPAPSAPLASGNGRPSAAVDEVSNDLSLPVATTGLRREVFGFLPYWELSNPSLTLDYGALSTVAYFGVGANKYGQLQKQNSDGTPTTGWAGWTSSKMTSILNDAHENGTRVVLTVVRFSWTTSQIEATTTLLESATYRQRLANELAAAVRQRGADGVNLDFEPIPSGQGANFVDLTRRVRAALDAEAPGYQLTFDATGYIGNYDIPALTAPGAADAVFVMGYDYRIGRSSRAGSIDPLSGPLYDITDTVNAFLARTTPDKVILGVPYYGRAWSTYTDEPNAYTRPQGSEYGYSKAVLYRYAQSTASTHGRRWDGVEQTPWTAYQWRNCSSCPLTWRELYYDDATSLGLRYDLVNRMNLRGTGMWALGYDGTRTELYSTLKKKFLNDGTPPLAGIRLLPDVYHDQGVLVDWVAVDDWSGIARYDVQVSVDGGAWTSWLTGTGLGAGIYLGEPGQGYAFRVRATDGQGNVGAWNVSSVWAETATLGAGGFARVLSSSLTMRSAPGTSATALGTLAAGQTVSIIGGPVSADGYTWYQITGPLREWGVVSATQVGAWVASGEPGTPWLAAAPAPNSTLVRPELTTSGVGAVHTASFTASSGTASDPLSSRVFSPNADGVRDALRVNYRVDDTLDSLTLRVYSASSRMLLGSASLPGRSGGDHTYDWNGQLDTGRVPDGEILLQLVGARDGATFTWPAANMSYRTFPTSGLAVTVDTVAPALGVPTATAAWFSPNGDGSRDSTSVAAAVSEATSWTLQISSQTALVRSFSGTGNAPSGLWDGRDTTGSRVADGPYRLRATAIDAAGNRATTYRWLWIDTSAPSGTLPISVPGALWGQTGYAFSPNGDGQGDTIRLGWQLGEVVAGTLSLRSGATSIWSTRIPSSTSGSVLWNGRDATGTAAADGTYTVVASVVDRAGNRSLLTANVVVDRTVGFLRPAPQFLHPSDGDGLAATTALSFRLTKSAKTTLRIYKGTTLVRTLWYGRSLASGTWSATWNGRDDGGALVAPGGYRAVLHVSRDGVRHVLAYGLRLDAFAIRVAPTPATAGDTVTVAAASSEPLATTPTITFAQPGLAPVMRSAVKQTDGRWAATFTVAAGGTGTAGITVQATDSMGGVNTSTTTVTVR